MIDSDGAGQTFDCEQTVRRLWDYLDAELDVVDVAAIDEHLRACAGCAGHYAFERRFLDVVRAAREVSGHGSIAGSTLRERVVRALVASGELPAPDAGS